MGWLSSSRATKRRGTSKELSRDSAWSTICTTGSPLLSMPKMSDRTGSPNRIPSKGVNLSWTAKRRWSRSSTASQKKRR